MQDFLQRKILDFFLTGDELEYCISVTSVAYKCTAVGHWLNTAFLCQFSLEILIIFLSFLFQWSGVALRTLVCWRERRFWMMSGTSVMRSPTWYRAIFTMYEFWRPTWKASVCPPRLTRPALSPPVSILHLLLYLLFNCLIFVLLLYLEHADFLTR